MIAIKGFFAAFCHKTKFFANCTLQQTHFINLCFMPSYRIKNSNKKEAWGMRGRK